MERGNKRRGPRKEIVTLPKFIRIQDCIFGLVLPKRRVLIFAARVDIREIEKRGTRTVFIKAAHSTVQTCCQCLLCPSPTWCPCSPLCARSAGETWAPTRMCLSRSSAACGIPRRRTSRGRMAMRVLRPAPSASISWIPHRVSPCRATTACIHSAHN